MKLSPKTSFITAVVLGSFAIIGGTGLTVSSAWLITMASEHPPVLVLGVAIVMVRFFGIFRSVARYGERVISHEAIFRKLTELRVELFQAFASRLRQRDGNVALQSKAAIDDVERAQEFHLRVTLPGLYASFSVAATIMIAAWISQSTLVLIGAISLVFAIAIPLLVRRYLDPVSIEIEDRENSFAQEISRASLAQSEAELFGYRDQYLDALRSEINALQLLERRFLFRTSLLQSVTILSIGGGLVGVAIASRGDSSLRPIQISMAIFLVLVGFEGYTSWFPNLFPAGKNRRAAANLQSLARISAPREAKICNPGEFTIRADAFTPYWNERFLAPISFQIAPGETFLITGPSGVGKSTLGAALTGFAPYDGSLTIGGNQLTEISNLNQCIAASLQEGYIFNTTLRENLRIAKEGVSDAELLTLVADFELDEIGLDEVLGEFGRTLSGGEAKRLATARALLSPAPIVLLDEPLEHLDHERSIRIQGAISRWAENRTLIVITHSPWLQYSGKLALERE